jgi:mannose-6-phosphate isomerase-like protein (cupin superfamily)
LHRGCTKTHIVIITKQTAKNPLNCYYGDDMKYVYSHSEALKKNVFGVDITGYNTPIKTLDIVFEETTRGRHEEFYDTVSTHMWLITEGEGTFVINDERYDVTARDLVIVPPKSRIYYVGTMKMVLVTTPGFEPKNEHHMRNVEL